MIASIVGDFHSGAITSFVDELGNRGVCADRVAKMSAFTWGDLSGLLRKFAAALAAQPLWRVARNWWRVEDDVGFWILNVGLADEEPLQRILNCGLSQRLQQGGWRG